MLDPGGVWADVLAWAIALATVLVLAGLVMLVHRLVQLCLPRHFRGAKPLRHSRGAKPSRHASVARTMPKREHHRERRLDRDREWELVMRRAARELARVPRVQELQANAAMQIDAAEYVYGRLIVDCARVCDMPDAPTSEPQPIPPYAAEEREPLAA